MTKNLDKQWQSLLNSFLYLTQREDYPSLVPFIQNVSASATFLEEFTAFLQEVEYEGNLYEKLPLFINLLRDGIYKGKELGIITKTRGEGFFRALSFMQDWEKKSHIKAITEQGVSEKEIVESLASLFKEDIDWSINDFLETFEPSIRAGEIKWNWIIRDFKLLEPLFVDKHLKEIARLFIQGRINWKDITLHYPVIHQNASGDLLEKIFKLTRDEKITWKQLAKGLPKIAKVQKVVAKYFSAENLVWFVLDWIQYGMITWNKVVKNIGKISNGDYEEDTIGFNTLFAYAYTSGYKEKKLKKGFTIIQRHIHLWIYLKKRAQKVDSSWLDMLMKKTKDKWDNIVSLQERNSKKTVLSEQLLKILRTTLNYNPTMKGLNELAVLCDLKRFEEIYLRLVTQQNLGDKILKNNFSKYKVQLEKIGLTCEESGREMRDVAEIVKEEYPGEFINATHLDLAPYFPNVYSGGFTGLWLTIYRKMFTFFVTKYSGSGIISSVFYNVCEDKFMVTQVGEHNLTLYFNSFDEYIDAMARFNDGNKRVFDQYRKENGQYFVVPWIKRML